MPTPMSEEQLKAFLEKVKSDTSLQEKLKAAADSDVVLRLQRKLGSVLRILRGGWRNCRQKDCILAVISM